MKKNIFYLFLGALVTLGACQEPEEFVPSILREGITSLSVEYPDGVNQGKVLVNYTIPDQSADKYVIPVPWYYPEESDNETNISRLKVKAELDNNCSIDPPLAVLDLTKENYFTFTDPQGKQKRICITGERTKSNKCDIKSFLVDDLGISGVVDQNKQTITLVSAEDLSNVTANVTLSAHATISPDPSVAHNLNEDFIFTVTAHDGVTKKEYKVSKGEPEKINYGFRTGSDELMFSSDIVAFSVKAPSLAATRDHLIVCPGNGTAPAYLNRATGKLLGQITLGSAKANWVASDVNGNVLIANSADAGTAFEIYTTKSATEAPKKLLSVTNNLWGAIGPRMSVQGDIEKDAVIIVPGVQNYFYRWEIKNGVVGNAELVQVSDVGSWWGGDAVSIVSRSTNVSDGYFLGFYQGPDYFNKLGFIDGTTNALSVSLGEQSDGSGSNMNNNCIDVKEFNRARYCAFYTPGHFTWSHPQLYVYDVTSMASFTGLIDTSEAMVYTKPSIWCIANDLPNGCVLVAPTLDGYKMHVYTIDRSTNLLEGISFDCVAQ